MKRKKWLKRIVYFGLGLFLFIYLNNSSLLVKRRENEPFFLAHRGLAQTFSIEGIAADTCTAERIYDPEHPFLENTIESMEAAFAAGADQVEFDIRPTKDGKFAVFHDWTLDCRTDLTGEPKEYTMDELKKADVGYGYTADGGKSYPFRGKGIGLMPSLDEVLTSFPDKELLIHIKSNDPEEGELLAGTLHGLSETQRDMITVYGGDAPIASLNGKIPNLRVMSKATLKHCLIPYFAFGWTGVVPASCGNSQIHIPENIAPWLWGWPDKFLNRMDSVDTRVIVVAGNGSWSEGFDTLEDLERLPKGYSGGIWTNRIDKITK